MARGVLTTTSFTDGGAERANSMAAQRLGQNGIGLGEPLLGLLEPVAGCRRRRGRSPPALVSRDDPLLEENSTMGCLLLGSRRRLSLEDDQPLQACAIRARAFEELDARRALAPRCVSSTLSLAGSVAGGRNAVASTTARRIAPLHRPPQCLRREKMRSFTRRGTQTASSVRDPRDLLQRRRSSRASSGARGSGRRS